MGDNDHIKYNVFQDSPQKNVAKPSGDLTHHVLIINPMRIQLSHRGWLLTTYIFAEKQEKYFNTWYPILDI